MSLNDTLANVLSQIDNAIKLGKDMVVTSVSSSLVRKVLDILHDEGYIGDIENIRDAKGNYFKVSLSGKMNACGVIKPRFAIKIDGFEKFEKRYLPAKGFGLIILSTNQGLLTHEQAKEKGIGGKLIGYCY